MVIVETSFPRGGVAPRDATAVEKPSENIIFGASQIKKKSEHKQNAKRPVDLQNEEEDHIEVASAGLVNYHSIQDGMLIMGIVKSVDQISVKISLPGRMTVKVLALSISDSYTKNVAQFVANSEGVENYKPLTEMFTEGQIVYGKVMDVKQQDTGRTEVSFSLKPNDVHSELVHSNVKKGFVFNGAIEEVQEHGYIIETGVRGLRCFLPIEKSRPGHAVGELVFMKVDELNAHRSVTTIRCKEVNGSNLKIKDQIDPNLDYLLPGTVVGFTVTKCLKDGLQGTIMNGAFTGYVNEHNLQTALGSLDDIQINSTLSARILYIAPLTKFVYLSLNLFESDEQSTAYQKGIVVQNAAVHHMGSGGIILILDNKYKGVVSLKTLKSNNIGNFDMDQILNKYTKRSKHPVRILDYDMVGGFFVCSDDPADVNEKVFTVNDVAVGDYCTATVVEKNKKVGGYSLKIGKAHGLIDKLFLSQTTTVLGDRSKLKCRVMSTNADRNIAYVTNLPEYMTKDSKVLTSLKDAKINSTFMGTIVKCEASFLVVKFFNDIKGILYRSRTNGITNFYEGQSMLFRITSRTDENIVLAMPEDTFDIGEFCRAKVTHVMDTGLEILVESKENDSFTMKAFVPERLLSDFKDLTSAKLKTYSIGQDVTACCISKNVFSIRDVPYFMEGAPEWKHVQAGDIYRAFIKNVEGDVLELVVPIKKYQKTVKLHRNMLVVNSSKPLNIVLEPEQVVHVKILSKDLTTKTIGVSAKLMDVWDGDMAKCGEHFAKYLSEVREIKSSLKAQAKPISKLTVGGKVSAVFQAVNQDTGDWSMELEKYKVIGTIKKHLLGKQKPLAEGESVECVVLWVDYRNEIAYLSCNPVDMSKINSDKKLPQNLVNKNGINAKAILKLDNAMLCSLKKGSNPLVFIPNRLDYNDFEGASSSRIKEGDFCKLTFVHETLPIAILDETHRVWQDLQKQKRKLEELLESRPKPEKVKKRKQAEEGVPPTKKAKQSKKNVKAENAKDAVMFYEDRVSAVVDTDEDPVPVKPRKRTLEETKSPLQVKRIPEAPTDSSNKKKPGPQLPEVKLPGASNFWSTNLTDIVASNNAESSSEEEEEHEDDTAVKKKKKLTTSEKFRADREEEARLTAIEDKLANPNILPETSDQFDRLVLSDPNNSKHWISYMVFHLQAMEIDRARGVARRALKSISFRESVELMNIWIAMLNMELRYGTKDSFNEVLNESLLSNDQCKIYMRVLEMYAEANKTQELVDLIGTVTKKFKDNLEMWKTCAIAFYKIGIHDRAQQMMHKALAVLPEREHVNTIVAFANLTHKYAKNPETAHVLLDQVVTSYPKRVDVWSQLVDMLIKDDQIESARRTLERAVIQKIPFKKMRTIFKKYMEFEENHGTPEDVEKVKAIAENYIKNNLS